MEGNINPADLGLATQLQMAAVLLESGTPKQKKMIEEFLSDLFKKTTPLESTNYPSYKITVRCEADKVNRSYGLWEGRYPEPRHVIAIASELRDIANEMVDGLPEEFQPVALAARSQWPELGSQPNPDYIFRVSYDDASRIVRCGYGWHGHPLPEQRAAIISLLEEAIEHEIAIFPNEPNALHHLATHQHYKGGLYRYRFDFKHSETGETMVAYRHLWPHEPGNWGRPKEMFHGNLEDGRVRFQPIVKE